jgi:hypothetical protein
MLQRKIKIPVINNKPNDVYSLNCDWYTKKFNSIQELIDDCISSGMDPNYEVLKNGVSTNELLFNHIQL